MNNNIIINKTTKVVKVVGQWSALQHTQIKDNGPTRSFRLLFMNKFKEQRATTATFCERIVDGIAE